MPVHDLGNGTWVLVADGKKALFLVNDGDAEYPVLNVHRQESQEDPADLDQSESRPGRVFQSAGSRRHAYEETDWHQLAEDRFADHLAELVNERALGDAFRRIVLVASPQVLGEMRPRLHKEAERRIVGEVAKTLTNHPVDEIEKILKAELATG